MTLQVPAGTCTGVGEKRVHAAFLLWIIGHKFSPAVFPGHGEVGFDEDGLQRIVFGVETPAQDAKVNQVGETRHHNQGEAGPENGSPDDLQVNHSADRTRGRGNAGG